MKRILTALAPVALICGMSVSVLLAHHPQAKQENRCPCFYQGYDDQRSGRSLDDPQVNQNLTDCDLKGQKRVFMQGWSTAAAGAPRDCPYKSR